MKFYNKPHEGLEPSWGLWISLKKLKENLKLFSYFYIAHKKNKMFIKLL